MAEMTFSPEDIRALATKLDDVTAGFDERERALLVATIGLARETLASRAKGEVAGFGSGRPAFDPMVVVKHTDMATPDLFRAVTSLSPAESVGLSYGKVEWTYTPQKRD